MANFPVWLNTIKGFLSRGSVAGDEHASPYPWILARRLGFERSAASNELPRSFSQKTWLLGSKISSSMELITLSLFT
jgi:hypothetical protein